MTAPTPAGGREGRMKVGDRVWIQDTVLGVREHSVLVGDEHKYETHVFAGFDEVLPDHPALPRIAAWLSEHPDGADVLAVFLDDLAYEEEGTLRALLAALTGEDAGRDG